jgi:hypothetical protein
MLAFICDTLWMKATCRLELRHYRTVTLLLNKEIQVQIMEKQKGYLPPKALGDACAGGAPNEEPPNGDPVCGGAPAAAAEAPKPPKTDDAPVADAVGPPKPPNEKPPVGAAAAGWAAPKPEKPLPKVEPPLAVLPNNGAPVDGIAVDGAANGDLKLKTPAGAPKPLPEDVEDAVLNAPPKGLVAGAELVKLGLPPNTEPLLVEDPKIPPKPAPVGAELVAAGEPPNIPLGAAEVARAVPPNIPVGAIEVVGAAPPNIPVGAVAEMLIPPNPLPNGLEVEAVGLVKGLALAAEDVAVAALASKPPPKAPVVEGDAIANGPVLENDGAVAIVGLNTLPNGDDAELAAEVLLPNAGAVPVMAKLFPNGIELPGLIVENPVVPLPRIGLEPNDPWPVDRTDFVVGEVDWTDVVVVEASAVDALKAGRTDDAGKILVGAVVTVGVVNDAAGTDEADTLGVLIPAVAGLTSEGVTWEGVAWTNGLELVSSPRMALSCDEANDADCDKSVAAGKFGLVCGSLIDASIALFCELGVAGVKEIVGTDGDTVLEGVW